MTARTWKSTRLDKMQDLTFDQQNCSDPATAPGFLDRHSGVTGSKTIHRKRQIP